MAHVQAKNLTRKIPILCSTGDTERVPKISHGTWYGSNHWGTRMPVDASFLSFQTPSEAKKHARLFKLHHPSLPRFLALEMGNDSSTVTVERLPSLSIQDWIDQGSGETVMWKLNEDGTQYLEMGSTEQKVFKSLSQALRYLHENGKYHGNLLNGIWLSLEPEVSVMLCSFDTAFDSYEGFRKDMDDLRTLVELAVENHSKGIHINGIIPIEPPTLAYFYDLCDHLKLAGNSRRRSVFADFVYWAPLFWDWVDCYSFICKLGSYSSGSFDKFFREFMEDARESSPNSGRAVRLGDPTNSDPTSTDPKKRKLNSVMFPAMPKIKDWQARILLLPKDSPLRRSFEKGEKSRMYKETGGIYWLYKNCIKHYGEACEEIYRETGVKHPSDDRAIMNALLQVYPDGISVIYEKMVFALFPQSESRFGINLISFLKSEPLALQ